MRKLLSPILFVALAAGSSAFAKDKDKDRGGFFIKRMTEELSLTADQQAQLKKIHDSSHEDVKAKREGMFAAHKDLESSLQSGAKDDEVRAKFAALQKKQEDFAKARFEKILQVRAILTPEQRSKMKAGPEGGPWMKEGREGRRHKFGRHQMEEDDKE